MSEITDLSGQSFRANLVGVDVGLEGEVCLLLNLVGRENGFRLPFSLVKDLSKILIGDALQVTFPEVVPNGHGGIKLVTVRVLKAGS